MPYSMMDHPRKPMLQSRDTIERLQKGIGKAFSELRKASLKRGKASLKRGKASSERSCKVLESLRKATYSYGSDGYVFFFGHILIPHHTLIHNKLEFKHLKCCFFVPKCVKTLTLSEKSIFKRF